MSMEDGRLDHLLLRVEALERAVGTDDAMAAGAQSVLARLKEAERGICDLEAVKANLDSGFTWQVVKDMCQHRDARQPIGLSAPQVKAIADLIEGEWGKQ